MFNVYFAGDLFDHKHITGNRILADYIEKTSQGLYKCILPQDWEGALNSPVQIRNKDIQMVAQADCVLFNFDGPDLDSGTVVEFMLAKMLDIPVVLLRTDCRNGGYLEGEDWNLMVLGYPRSIILKHPALMMYNTHGLAETHSIIAQSVIEGLEQVKKQESLFCSYEEIFAAYQHVIKMCGANLNGVLPAALIQEIIVSKIQKNIYPSYAVHSSFVCNFLSQ